MLFRVEDTSSPVLNTQAPLPRHCVLPDIQSLNEVVYQLGYLANTLVMMTFQYLNLYNTIWWMPNNYHEYAIVSRMIGWNLRKACYSPVANFHILMIAFYYGGQLINFILGISDEEPLRIDYQKESSLWYPHQWLVVESLKSVSYRVMRSNLLWIRSEFNQS